MRHGYVDGPTKVLHSTTTARVKQDFYLLPFYFLY